MHTRVKAVCLPDTNNPIFNPGGLPVAIALHPEPFPPTYREILHLQFRDITHLPSLSRLDKPDASRRLSRFSARPPISQPSQPPTTTQLPGQSITSIPTLGAPLSLLPCYGPRTCHFITWKSFLFPGQFTAAFNSFRPQLHEPR